MRLPFFICFLLVSAITNAQSVDSIETLTNGYWRVKGNWFGSDTVTMRKVYSDTVGKNRTEQAIDFIKANEKGEMISIDNNGVILKHYHQSERCPVGELISKLLEFKLSKGKVLVHYRYDWWNAKPEWTPEIEERIWYKVITWSATDICLVKEK